MNCKYIALHNDITEESVENLENVIVNNGFTYSNFLPYGTEDVVIWYEMGDDLPAGVEIYNEDVLNNKEIMDVLFWLEENGENDEDDEEE